MNKRRKSGGQYASAQELGELVEEAYATAIDKAALEAFEGMYSEQELAARIEVDAVKKQALALVLESLDQRRCPTEKASSAAGLVPRQ